MLGLIACADFFDKGFFQQLVANALAVILGIPAGILLHHVVSRWASTTQRQQLRHALKRAVEHNLGTLKTIKEQLTSNIIPTFSLDLVLFDATAHTKYDVLNDITLCTTIDHLRFELSHLARQVDALLGLELDSSARAEGNFVEGRKPSLYNLVHPQLVQSVMGRLPPLEQECKEVLAKLDGK